MRKKYRYILFTLFSLLCLALLVLLFPADKTVAVLDPKGIIGLKQKNLLITSTWLMLIVVIPVFILTIFVAWKYRADNKQAKYNPDWDQSLLAETIWWGIPFIIIVILGIMTWTSSRDLDPFKPLDTGTKPLKVQVVALQWKWLFIYPEQNIATLNYLQFPEKTPVHFEITADAPMNSFWIPQLGGQIYAMPGMSAQLHLIADEVGDYRGSSANLSGEGFSSMHFVAEAVSPADFSAWAESVKQSSPVLSRDEYKKLTKPSEHNPGASYSLKEKGLYEWVVMKYMHPSH